MKYFLISEITSIILAIGGILLALNGVKGWGWVIFCAVITQASEELFKKED